MKSTNKRKLITLSTVSQNGIVVKMTLKRETKLKKKVDVILGVLITQRMLVLI